MGQIIKKQAQSDAHQQGRRKPAVEDERQETTTGCRHDDQHKDGASQRPLKELIPAPKPALEEKILVIKETRGNQPQRSKGGHDVIGIVLGVVDVGVVLQVHPREHRVTEAQQQRGAMAHHRIPKAIGMGRVVAGIVNHGALEMQSQKANQHQQGQRPLAHKPTPNREGREGITTQKQANGGVKRCWGFNEMARHRAQGWALGHH